MDKAVSIQLQLQYHSAIILTQGAAMVLLFLNL